MRVKTPPTTWRQLAVDAQRLSRAGHVEGYAATLADIGPLADAGADFVALGDAIWSAPAPVEALAQARAILARRPD